MHMTAKVIPRVTGGVLILQQLPSAVINNATPHAAINSTSPNLSKMIKKTSTARRFTYVSQATQREDTQALRGSRPSGPPRESSGARSDPPSSWGSGETKKRIIDALKMSYLTYICSLEMKQQQLPPAVESIMQGYMSCTPQSMT